MKFPKSNIFSNSLIGFKPILCLKQHKPTKICLYYPCSHIPGQSSASQYGVAPSPTNSTKTTSRTPHRPSTSLFVNRTMLVTLLSYSYNPFTSENINIRAWYIYIVLVWFIVLLVCVSVVYCGSVMFSVSYRSQYYWESG